MAVSRTPQKTHSCDCLCLRRDKDSFARSIRRQLPGLWSWSPPNKISKKYGKQNPKTAKQPWLLLNIVLLITAKCSSISLLLSLGMWSSPSARSSIRCLLIVSSSLDCVVSQSQALTLECHGMPNCISGAKLSGYDTKTLPVSSRHGNKPGWHKSKRVHSKIAAYVFCSLCDDCPGTLVVGHLKLDAEYHRLGVGTMLLAAGQIHASQRGWRCSKAKPGSRRWAKICRPETAMQKQASTKFRALTPDVPQASTMKYIDCKGHVQSGASLHGHGGALGIGAAVLVDEILMQAYRDVVHYDGRDYSRGLRYAVSSQI